MLLEAHMIILFKVAIASRFTCDSSGSLDCGSMDSSGPMAFLFEMSIIIMSPLVLKVIL
jgi:hypothetical protein